LEEYIIARIIVEIDDSKAAILREKAKRVGLLPEQLVIASIEGLILQPEPDFDEAIIASSGGSHGIRDIGALFIGCFAFFYLPFPSKFL